MDAARVTEVTTLTWIRREDNQRFEADITDLRTCRIILLLIN